MKELMRVIVPSLKQVKDLNKNGQTTSLEKNGYEVEFELEKGKIVCSVLGEEKTEDYKPVPHLVSFNRTWRFEEKPGMKVLGYVDVFAKVAGTETVYKDMVVVRSQFDKEKFCAVEPRHELKNGRIVTPYDIDGKVKTLINHELNLKWKDVEVKKRTTVTVTKTVNNVVDSVLFRVLSDKTIDDLRISAQMKAFSAELTQAMFDKDEAGNFKVTEFKGNKISYPELKEYPGIYCRVVEVDGIKFWEQNPAKKYGNGDFSSSALAAQAGHKILNGYSAGQKGTVAIIRDGVFHRTQLLSK